MNSILISLAISVLITLASVGFEYALRPRKGVVPPMDDLRLSTSSYGDDSFRLAKWGVPHVTVHPGDVWHDVTVLGATTRVYIPGLSGVPISERRCEYCKSVQGVGGHCLNCGAPLG